MLQYCSVQQLTAALISLPSLAMARCSRYVPKACFYFVPAEAAPDALASLDDWCGEGGGGEGGGEDADPLAAAPEAAAPDPGVSDDPDDPAPPLADPPVLPDDPADPPLLAGEPELGSRLVGVVLIGCPPALSPEAAAAAADALPPAVNCQQCQHPVSTQAAMPAISQDCEAIKHGNMMTAVRCLVCVLCNCKRWKGSLQ